MNWKLRRKCAKRGDWKYRRPPCYYAEGYCKGFRHLMILGIRQSCTIGTATLTAAKPIYFVVVHLLRPPVLWMLSLMQPIDTPNISASWR